MGHGSRGSWVSKYDALVNELTVSVDLQFAEISAVRARKLQDDVSVSRQAAGTLQVNSSTVWHSARVLTTDSVVPQRRCSDGR